MRTKKLRVDRFSRMCRNIFAHTLKINLEHRSMKQKWGLLALISLFFIHWDSSAQIESMYSLYRLNPQSISSGEVGLRDSLSAIIVNRQQWIGMEGAPKTLGFGLDMKWKKQSGLGLNVMYDQAGPVQVSTFAVDYAYHTRLNSAWTLSGGIRLGLGSVNLNFDNMSLVHTSDDAFGTNQSTGLRFNTGWGIRVGSKGGTYISVSQPRLLKYDFGDRSGAYLDVPYYYFSLGTQVKTFPKLVLMPSILVRIAKDVPLSYDVNLVSRWNQKLDLGLSYRKENSIGFMFGFQASSRIYLGYIYENPISVLSQVKLQTHELALRFRIK